MQQKRKLLFFLGVIKKKAARGKKPGEREKNGKSFICEGTKKTSRHGLVSKVILRARVCYCRRKENIYYLNGFHRYIFRQPTPKTLQKLLKNLLTTAWLTSKASTRQHQFNMHFQFGKRRAPAHAHIFLNIIYTMDDDDDDGGKRVKNIFQKKRKIK